MNSGLYTACSGLKANAEMLEVLSNNLANSNTTAFKGDESFFRIYNHALSESTVAPLDRVINDSTVVQGSLTNFQPGPLIQTGGTLDVALEGPGFFVLDGPGGPLYTRNGNFHLSAEGKLINADGLPVLGKKGAILIPRGQISISQAGEVQLNAGGRIDTIKVVDFPDRQRLQKVGNSTFKMSVSGVTPKDSPNTIVRQGSLEQSNVNPIKQMIMMIDMMRQFEGLQKAIQLTMNTVNDRSINQVGRVAG